MPFTTEKHLNRNLSQELIRAILQQADLPSVLAFGSTCHFNYGLVAVDLRATITRLTVDVANPERLRYFLESSGSYIGGEKALCFITRNWSITSSVLELFIPQSKSAAAILYLTVYEGYTYEDRVFAEDGTEAYSSTTGGFGSILYFRRNSSQSSVLVFVSHNDCALSPFPYMWATHTMNFIGGRSFGTLYPIRTLHLQSIINTACLSDVGLSNFDIQRLVFMARQRGFTVKECAIAFRYAENHKARCLLFWDCPQAGRFIGDGNTLVRRLLSRAHAPYAVPIDIDERSGPMTMVWKLGGKWCGWSCRGTNMDDMLAPHEVKCVTVLEAEAANVHLHEHL